MINGSTILLFTAIAISIVLVTLANWYCNWRERLLEDHFRKRMENEPNGYRIRITIRNILLMKAVKSKNYSEAFNEAISYSFEQTEELPDILVLTKNKAYF